MKLEQHYNRKETPLKWHRFSVIMGFVFAALLLLIGVVIFINSNNPDFQSSIEIIASEQGMVFPFSIEQAMTISGSVCIGFGIVVAVIAFLGAKFSPVYLVLTAISIVFAVITTVSATVNAFSGTQLISLVLTLVINGCIVLYYYKRLPLFSKNYAKNLAERQQKEEVNYDELNAQKAE